VTEAAAPLNYTTQIRADKTASECLAILGRSGASAVTVTYADREPAGLAFRLDTPGGPKDFQLSVNVDGVLSCLMKAHRTRVVALRYASRDQAQKVAWRILKDWLEAQVAIIAAQMATLDEVMLPYLALDTGQTLYQAYAARESLAAIGDGR
jgi:hypothetical protein